jgi:hypothetical protein
MVWFPERAACQQANNCTCPLPGAEPTTTTPVDKNHDKEDKEQEEIYREMGMSLFSYFKSS